MGYFVYIILNSILGLLSLAIILSAILSWLIAFDVINRSNRFVWSVASFLDAVTRPVLAPFRRIIPPLGGVDISPIIALILIEAVRRALLPYLLTLP